MDEAVVPHPYIHKVFNGSLWNPTRWKGPPTEEVENAWYEIMQCEQGHEVQTTHLLHLPITDYYDF